MLVFIVDIATRAVKMLGMGKAKKKTAGKSKIGRPAKPEGERFHDGMNLNVWIDKVLGQQFEETRKIAKRTKTAHLEFILELFFKSLPQG